LFGKQGGGNGRARRFGQSGKCGDLTKKKKRNLIAVYREGIEIYTNKGPNMKRTSPSDYPQSYREGENGEIFP